jgi:ferritin-like metal-binding protein YciE
MAIDTDNPEQLASARALVAQQLSDAHAMETALVTTLQAHVAMTPRGAYRELLEIHLDETREHARAIERRLGELGDGTSVVAAAVGLVQTVVGQVLALSKGPIDALRGASEEEKLLKNARDECATEALEIATYDALETIARAVGDQKTVALAERHRAAEERMLEGLRGEIPGLADATVRERVGRSDGVGVGRTDGGGGRRDVGGRGDDDGDRGDSGELPIAGYDTLSAGQVIKRLPRLSGPELRRVADYERAHRARSTVLARVEQLERSRG